jgi:hypothetical protein
MLRPGVGYDGFHSPPSILAALHYSVEWCYNCENIFGHLFIRVMVRVRVRGR